jgi:hypothetical protein
LNTGIPRSIDIGGWPIDRPLVVLALQHFEDPGFDFSSCEGIPWGGSCNMFVQDARNNAPPAFCTTPDEVHDFISYVVSHYNVDPKRVYITAAAAPMGGNTWRNTTPRCRSPPSRSPAKLGQHGRQATVASVRRRCGRSTARSTMS